MSVSKNCLWDDFRDSNHNDEPIFYNQNVRNKYFTISYIINFCMWSTKMILLAFFCTIWAFASQFVLKVGVLNSWLDNINWRKILITGLPGRALSRKPLWSRQASGVRARPILWSVWQDVGIKSSPISLNCCTRIRQMSFYYKIDPNKNRPKVSKYLGLFCE